MFTREVIVYWTAQVDIYCERNGPGLFEEPLNALTNGAFFVAAARAAALAHRRRVLDSGTWLLVGLAMAVGVGSTLFHTFATHWAMILDVLPILIFQLVFLWLYLARVVRLHSVFCTALTLMYLGTALWVRQFTEPLNGSVSYVPALLVVGGLGVYHLFRCKQDRMALLISTAAFFAAMFFRSIDMHLCGTCPRGTHFLWHLLIATSLYFAASALIVNQPLRPVKGETAT